MFCPKCGNNNPDEVRFCKVCGHPLNLNNPAPAFQQTQPTQPAQQFIPQQPQQFVPQQPQQPVQQFVPQQPQQPVQQFAPQAAPKMTGKPKAKYSFLFSVAPKGIKMTAIIALVLGLVCILSVVLGANQALNGDVFELPLIKMVVSEDEIDEARETVDKAVDEIEKIIDENDKDELKEIEKKAGIKAKKILDAFDPPSLNSMKKLGKAILDDDSVVEAFSIFISIVTIYALIAGVSLALAMLVGRGGYAIFTLIVVAPFHIFLSGGLWLAVGLIAHLAMIVCMFKMTSAYKKYKKSFVK